MKESITKFDLEAAFKALDEIDIPTSNGIKANKPALTEIFSRKTKLDALMEEYYDVSNMEELDDAKEAREAEVAKAKLARIEKIVDLDAESPEDLLTSYVGKHIIQCPQCMTLFYKNPEDIEESEEDPMTVNVNEVCQHCGNESGYTLIGKVGEVTAEEAENFEAAEEETVDVTSTKEGEDSEDVPAEEEASEEDLDLDAELEDIELDLDIEDDESSDEEKTEEALETEGSETVLVEQLHEEKELDVSADEFEKLINSSEFKQPISDTEARSMIAELEAPEEEPKEELEEGIFDKLKDKLFSKLKSREAKADWILNNAMKDYDKAVLKDGGIKVEKANRKFSTYVVIGYTNKFKSGEEIETAPAPDFKNSLMLTPGMKYPEITDKYANAEKIAKGWSMKESNGPAFIYLAEDAEGKQGSFLCQYFAGSLDAGTDKLEKYFEAVKKNIEGSKLMAQGGANQSDVKSTAASELKQGMFIKFDDDSTAEIIKIEQSGKLSNTLKVFVKYDDGTSEPMVLNADFKVNVLRTAPAKEDFNTYISGIEDLQENYLEELISNSLISTYQNVAGYRLTGCNYLNEKLNIEGTVYFTSGNTRNTTYSFTEAFNIDSAKTELHGLNEKLGLDKQFIITGYTDDNKTFIAESFKCSKR